MTQSVSPQEKANEFLQTAGLYQLGRLPTESSHPDTRQLAHLARTAPEKGVELLRQVDLSALAQMQAYGEDLQALRIEIQATLAAGGRVFLCGCGATGRLSLSLEFLWRTLNVDPSRSESVIAFMAGGDVALVHSLEGFEDFPSYGAEQLRQLGFSERDLLISTTEGGETPFVLGATEEATKISRRKPYLLYCNPRETLVALVERSKRALENPAIRNICLYVGPMALSGSTRMQASTALMLGVGWALLTPVSGESNFCQWLKAFCEHYQQIDLSWLSAFIEKEADTYLAHDKVHYEVSDFAITVFTDTTERAPTFSLPPFNNQWLPRKNHSLAYIMISGASSVQDGWHRLLTRSPRVLNWPNRNNKTTMEYLGGFDFSQDSLAYRKKALPACEHQIFSILESSTQITFQFRGLKSHLLRSKQGLLADHLILKMVLNIHSTLMMGRLGRYESNFMTWVYPTNGKLIDRATRYTMWMLENHGSKGIKYDEVVHELFRQFADIQENESVVVKTFTALMKTKPEPSGT